MSSSSKALLGVAALAAAAAYATSPSRKGANGEEEKDEEERQRKRVDGDKRVSRRREAPLEALEPTLRRRRGQPPPSAEAEQEVEGDGDTAAVATVAAEEAAPSKMKKSESFTELAGRMIHSASRASLSPTQRLRLEGNVEEDHSTNKVTSVTKVRPPSKTPRKSKRNSIVRVIVGILSAFVMASYSLVLYYELGLPELFTLVHDVLSFERVPASAQDISGAIVATCACICCVFIMDVLIAKPIFPGDAAQWFCLHALANAFVVLGAVPDFYFVSLLPSQALSAAQCHKMGKWACSDWPTCMIIAIHIYHMLAFKLSSDDLFHHLTFVPVIGGGHFVWPWGAAGNILCFFISGFPGGIDYALLAMVKAGWVSSMTEKRINLSINVWIRAPGITTFCILAATSWLQSSEWLEEGATGEIMPAWGFVPALLLVFYNGQYYGMRVIGNYYIRITENAFSAVTKDRPHRPALHGC